MPTWMALTDVTCYVEAARHKAAFVESEKSTLDETVVFRDENLCDIDLEEARPIWQGVKWLLRAGISIFNLK